MTCAIVHKSLLPHQIAPGNGCVSCITMVTYHASPFNFNRQALADGKPLIIEGLHLDPGQYMREFSDLGAVLLPDQRLGRPRPDRTESYPNLHQQQSTTFGTEASRYPCAEFVPCSITANATANATAGGLTTAVQPEQGKSIICLLSVSQTSHSHMHEEKQFWNTSNVSSSSAFCGTFGRSKTSGSLRPSQLAPRNPHPKRH